MAGAELTLPCPACRGKKGYRTYLCIRDGSGCHSGWSHCKLCAGTGEMPVERRARWMLGQQLRQVRLNCYECLVDAAISHGYPSDTWREIEIGTWPEGLAVETVKAWIAEYQQRYERWREAR